MVFDAKIMTLHIKEPKQGLSLGYGKKTYSYMKIKRQLENKIKLENDTIGTTTIQKQVKLDGVPIALEVDTTPQFYHNLRVRDPSFKTSSNYQKIFPSGRKTYDYINLKRLRSSFYPPENMSTQVDFETLKKEHKNNVNDVIFSVEGVKSKPNAI